MTNYLIDLDGTLYRGDQVIPQAAAFVQHLHRTGQPHLFVTNCPLNSPQALVDKLRGMGIPAELSRVLTCAQATVDYLQNCHPGEAVYPLCSPAFQQLLREGGVPLCTSGGQHVVVGHATHLTYDQISEACNSILQGAQLVASNPDRAIPHGSHTVPHTGALTAALVAVTGCTPRVIGKPGGLLLQSAMARLGSTNPGDYTVVGDNLTTDMPFAYQNGMKSILVLTGATTREMLQKELRQPDVVVEQLTQLL